MNLFNSFDHETAMPVSYGVSTLLVSAEGVDGPMARKLAGLGCYLETSEELYSALDQVITDPSGYELIVVDCDSIGGLQQGLRAHALLEVTQRCIPMILVSRECKEQIFPASRYEPTVLRMPLSTISLRVGFEHAVQERLLMSRAI